MRRLPAVCLAVLLLIPKIPVQAAGPDVKAPSAFVVEASTGKVVYEKNADEKRPPASVTKVMTLLLIFDALEEGKISLTDEVTVSEYAASMGGSQVFLEPGEIQTVDTLIKCIAVASANDACVAMAEYVWGSEEEFVKKMNQRADGLGMSGTTFVNCNGLDAEGHVTTARDIASMSRELILRYPQIHDYAGIWMEDITHNTARGSSTFTLANTNKLIRQYAYATGLKTGSTDEAGFCISATAKKNQMEMIAVVMGAGTSKERFQDAVSLLDYGLGCCVKYIDEGKESLSPVKVKGGTKQEVSVEQEETFQYVDTEGSDLSKIKKNYKPEVCLEAPVTKGDKAGKVIYTLNGKKIGTVDLVAAENVKKASCLDLLEQIMKLFFLTAAVAK